MKKSAGTAEDTMRPTIRNTKLTSILTCRPHT